MRAQKTQMSSIYALLCVQEAIVWCCKIVCCEINLTALRLKSAVVSFCFCLTAVSAVCRTRPSALDSITQLIEFVSTRIGSGKKLHTVDKNVCTLFLRLKTWIQFLKSHSENFPHNCTALSTLFNDLPRTHEAKSSTNKAQSQPFNRTFTALLISGDRMLLCGTPISCCEWQTVCTNETCCDCQY